MLTFRNTHWPQVAIVSASLAIVALYPKKALSSPNAAEKASAVQKASTPQPVLSEKEIIEAVNDLRTRNLLFPIAGFDVERVKDSYQQERGNQSHEAIDILAPRNTPIVAVENGEIAKLFLSKPGGITIYQFDPSKKYVYYYAHLEKYAEGLKDGEKVRQGQILGFVGTSGDAPPDTPHLHFSISLPDAEKKWWQTAPINPYLVFRKPPTQTERRK